MTEFSWPWQCTATGDGGASSFSLDIVEDTNKFLQNIDPTLAGIVYWTESPYANLLAPSNPSTGVVRIASGVGIVEGWIYTNDSNVDFDINSNPGNANATDIIALRRDLAGQTVRLVRLNGAASTKATLTQTAATWEIPIVDVALDAGGNFSSLTDARKLALPPATVILLGEFEGDGATAAATLSNIPPLFSAIRIVGRGRGTTAAATDIAALTFNSDVGNNYDWIRHNADSTSTLNTASGAADTAIDFPVVTAASGTTNYFDGFEIIVPVYAKTGYKSALAKYSTYGDGTAYAVARANGWWQNTASITRIDLTLTNWATGSKISFYGIV